MVNQLTKSSSQEEIKGYFQAMLRLSQQKDGNEFPINLDEVWPLVYAEKGKAVRALKQNFFEGVDFVTASFSPLAQNGKQKGGHNEVIYYLTLSCLEYFIARKVRPVFEVYRQVFHKVAQAAPSLSAPASGSYATRLAETEYKVREAWKAIRELEEESRKREEESRKREEKYNDLFRMVTSQDTSNTKWQVKELWLEQQIKQLKNVSAEIKAHYGKSREEVAPVSPVKSVNGECYMTVQEYAVSKGLRIDHATSVSLGHIASNFCRQAGYVKQWVPDGWGRSRGSYPVSILERSFESLTCKVAAL